MMRFGSVALRMALGLAAGCAAPRHSPPDILLVVIDTLRADHCSAFGYARPTTPNLASLAARGIAFDAAYSPMSTTGPAHATLFTSLQPLHHGIMRNGLVLDEHHRTLAERLAHAGYRTAAFVSSFPVSARFGFAQGFGHYDDHFGTEPGRFRWWAGVDVPGGFERSPQATTDAAIDWIRSDPDDSALFAFVHYFDPHAPLAPPAEFERRFARPHAGERDATIDRYDAEVAHVDAQLGRLLAFFESRRGGRELLTIVTADHGEGLWDHGERGHNRTTYEEEVRVPLVMHWNGRLASGHRIGSPVQLVDLAPTILSAAGIDAPNDAEGIDLLAWAEQPARPERVVWLQRPYYLGAPAAMFDAQRKLDRGLGLGLRKGRWKYFEAREQGVRRLFDLSSDPRENHNLAESRPEIADALAVEVDRFVASRGVSELPTRVAPDTLEGLRALGYADQARD